jgi:hypothetical protein
MISICSRPRGSQRGTRAGRFGPGPTGDEGFDLDFLRRLVSTNIAKTTDTAVITSPISRIVVKFASSESRVCETMTVMLAATGLAMYHPELLLYCKFAVALRS